MVSLMMIAGLIGGFGLISMIIRKSLLGLFIGIHLLIVGSTMMLTLAGFASGMLLQSYIFSLFVTLSGVAQLVVGFTLAIRLFFLKQSVSLEELQTLKQ